MSKEMEHYPGMACDLGQIHDGACVVNGYQRDTIAALPAAEQALKELRLGIDQALAAYGLPIAARNALNVAVGRARQVLREGGR